MNARKVALAAISSLSLTLAACSSGGSSTQSGSSTQPPPPADWSKVSTYLKQSVSSGTLSGYSFAIFDSTNVVFTQSGGDQTSDSVEALASASKLPAVAAIMTLVDSGQLNLDTPVATYLNGHINWPSGKSAITMRMLLSHTSGLPDDTSATTPGCMSDRLTTTLENCAQAIADTPLANQPGTSFDYGGVDYQLAGYVATIVAGKTRWQDFFNGAIATPMKLVTLNWPDVETNPLIGGGASSNLGDYASFLRMILDDGSLDGQKVLSASAVAEIEKNEVGGGVNVVSSPLPAVQYPGYGMGVFISASDLHPGSPGPEYSDPGMLGSVPWFDLGLNYGAVLLITDTATTGVDVWNGLRPLIIPQMGGS